MRLYDSQLYRKEVRTIADLPIEWDKLENRTIMLSGATGMIGSFFIDVILSKWDDLHCNIIALGRDEKKAKDRFGEYLDGNRLQFVVHDVCCPISYSVKIDYILHLASNTHPLAYSQYPIETITTNIIGTYNLLKTASKMNCRRTIFASTVEIYGANRGDVELFDEHYCGYIDCNTMRAGYPESKRAGEALCQAFIQQEGLDIVIPRLPRTYGPTMQMTDSKASSQFLKKALLGEDIVLKSKGDQFFSYCHVADAVAGMLFCLLRGKCGEAYNIADEKSDIRLRDLAQMLADYAGLKVVFELPSEGERAGYSGATKARLDSSKIKQLGWEEKFPLPIGIRETLQILKKMS